MSRCQAWPGLAASMPSSRAEEPPCTRGATGRCAGRWRWARTSTSTVSLRSAQAKWKFSSSTPLPCWTTLTGAERSRVVAQLVAAIDADSATTTEDATRITQQDPLGAPLRTKTPPARRHTLRQSGSGSKRYIDMRGSVQPSGVRRGHGCRERSRRISAAFLSTPALARGENRVRCVERRAACGELDVASKRRAASERDGECAACCDEAESRDQRLRCEPALGFRFVSQFVSAGSARSPDTSS